MEINYPDEPLAGSLNREKIKSKYSKKYKVTISGEYSANMTYTGKIPQDDMTLTAIYTDIAGNTSTASMRVFAKPDTDSDTETIEVSKDGNDATVEETRGAIVYYIGIRREKQTGINGSVFGFMN